MPSPAARCSRTIRHTETGDYPRLRGRCRQPVRARRMRPAFSFGGGRLSQHRPGELPRLSHREACPAGAFAARALPEADEDPRGGITRIAEREPADREFPPAARTQVLVPSIRIRARIWTWPHHVPPGLRPAAAYTPMGISNIRAAAISAWPRHAEVARYPAGQSADRGQGMFLTRRSYTHGGIVSSELKERRKMSTVALAELTPRDPAR
jgi:hypothetical protein